jgi:hypothetical protein
MKLRKIFRISDSKRPVTFEPKVDIQIRAIGRDVSDEEMVRIKKRRTEETRAWQALPIEKRNAITLQQRRELAVQNWERMVRSGTIEKFEWNYGGGNHDCAVCKRKHGKTFRLAKFRRPVPGLWRVLLWTGLHMLCRADHFLVRE